MTEPTEEESEMLHAATEKFWLAFSKLCNDAIAEIPEHLRAEATLRFGDLTSIYGRKLP